MTTPADGSIVFIGIGSNLDGPMFRCQEAIGRIKAIKECFFLRHASFYRTEPVGHVNQDWFVNTVLELRTTLSASNLMLELQCIESQMGRERLFKWGPRLIDLDILLYGQEVFNEAALIVPHPELHKRRFVMEPLNEIASYVIHPAFGVSVAGLMQRLHDNSQVVRITDNRGTS